MSDKQFFYMQRRKQRGPVPLTHLQQLVRAGQIKPTDYVWQKGTPTWVTAARVPGLIDVGQTGTSASGMASKNAFPTGGGWRLKLFWLITSSGGVRVLTGAAAVLLLGGIVLLLFFRGEAEPTRVTIDELEDSARTAESRWLEISDGVLYWRELVAQMKSPALERGNIECFFVPLVSQAVFRQWAQTPDGEKFPYDRARVVVRFTVSQLEERFPGVLASFLQKMPIQPGYAEFQPAGTLGNYPAIAPKVRDEMQKTVKDQDPRRMLLLVADAKPASYAPLGLCLLGVGLVLLVAPGVWLYQHVVAPRLAAHFEPAAPARDSPLPAPRAQSAPLEAAQQLPKPPPAGRHKFYYSRRNKMRGPQSFAQLQQLAAAGRLARHDLIYLPRQKKWVPARKVSKLFPKK